MASNILIDRLVIEGAKRPMPRPAFQIFLGLGITFLYLTLITLPHGFRSDLMDKMAEFSYLLELILLMVLSFSGALSACALARPDGMQTKGLHHLPFFIASLLGLLILIKSSGFTFSDFQAAAMQTKGLDCTKCILLMALPPGILTFVIVGFGMSTHPARTGGMAALSVASFAYFWMRLIEPTDNIPHILIWHGLPVLALCLVGVLAGRAYLSWRPANFVNVG